MVKTVQEEINERAKHILTEKASKVASEIVGLGFFKEVSFKTLFESMQSISDPRQSNSIHSAIKEAIIRTHLDAYTQRLNKSITDKLLKDE